MIKTQESALPEDVLIPHFGQDATLVGVEIGTSGGVGCFGMLNRLPNLTMYTIDPFKHIDGSLHESSLPQEVLDEGYVLALDRLSYFKGRVTVIRKASDDAVQDVPDVVDFVHIDGDHTYEQVIRDIDNYLPKIRKGGLISGHDYILQAGVVRAVHERFKTVNFEQDYLWWVHV